MFHDPHAGDCRSVILNLPSCMSLGWSRSIHQLPDQQMCSPLALLLTSCPNATSDHQQDTVSDDQHSALFSDAAYINLDYIRSELDHYTTKNGVHFTREQWKTLQGVARDFSTLQKEFDLLQSNSPRPTGVILLSLMESWVQRHVRRKLIARFEPLRVSLANVHQAEVAWYARRYQNDLEALAAIADWCEEWEEEVQQAKHLAQEYLHATKFHHWSMGSMWRHWLTRVFLVVTLLLKLVAALGLFKLGGVLLLSFATALVIILGKLLMSLEPPNTNWEDRQSRGDIVGNAG